MMGVPANPQTPMLAIVGPTGSGKSSLAIDVAQRVGGEILSCDSIQIYRGFDIGSAKASADECERAKHHLIDIANWDDPFDAQQYREVALEARADVIERGRVPILCGGTGLYLRLLRWGAIDVPASAPALREELEAAERESPGATLARLGELDPESAETLDPNNLRHMVRALEICLQTGRAASAIRKEHGFRSEEVPMRVVWVQWEAELLRARIQARIHAMVDQGLLDEVQGLLDAGVTPTCSPMRSVGYRESCEVISGETDRAGFEERIFKSTWAYARRQRTWFRKERNIEVLEVNDLDSALDAVLAT